MKILVLSMNHAPELTGIGKYTGEMVDGLIDRGHEVTVVCAPPYYPQWHVLDGYHAASYSTESPRARLRVVRCPVWVPARPGGLKRIVHLASFALSSLPVMAGLAAWRPDVVFAVAPSLMAAPTALMTARLCGAASWLHVQDLEVDAAFELGLLRGAATRRRVQQAEASLLRAFDHVSTISERMLDALVGKGLPRAGISLFPNGVDVTRIRPAGRSPELRRELGIRDDQMVCLYAGTMNRKQGLPLLVQSARQLQARDDIVFVLSGDGEMRASLEADARGLTNVRFPGLCGADALNELLNMADIHLLPQLRGAADLVMPSKLTGMLASGRPVIASASPGTEIAQVMAGIGRVIEPESLEALSSAIVELVSDSATRARMSGLSRDYALRHLSSTALLERLDARLSGLAQTPSGTLAPGLANA